jgi:hypothetical protein
MLIETAVAGGVAMLVSWVVGRSAAKETLTDSKKDLLAYKGEMEAAGVAGLRGYLTSQVDPIVNGLKTLKAQVEAEASSFASSCERAERASTDAVQAAKAANIDRLAAQGAAKAAHENNASAASWAASAKVFANQAAANLAQADQQTAATQTLLAEMKAMMAGVTKGQATMAAQLTALQTGMAAPASTPVSKPKPKRARACKTCGKVVPGLKKDAECPDCAATRSNVGAGVGAGAAP